ncbi:hypothetical protein [Alicyclobacillus acidoterrestris]|uniref:Uncharacterized protein n=1 Tax=Alicyclobacillus acidoterrestris (strain ATCC 49025 / DSM 3922 / CIP 106132 / NCIMB 13137 / GD3B) TaxID=1356854 RepID=T0D305_ALIAG|nr:hypothetical protein [Alicyclobacillus acidoterrestris]EPZ44111.1 hypothetical protein N007_11350 [Alicyclobacillus acidoterrestris ATCC 49025]UNO49632.1 hypothetical protein K1I37_03585 [Alicyclobacillus acidoterrestris]
MAFFALTLIQFALACLVILMLLAVILGSSIRRLFPARDKQFAAKWAKQRTRPAYIYVIGFTLCFDAVVILSTIASNLIYGNFASLMLLIKHGYVPFGIIVLALTIFGVGAGTYNWFKNELRYEKYTRHPR